MNKYYKQYLNSVKEAVAVIAEGYKGVFPIEFSNYKVDASNIRVETPDLEDLSVFQNTKLSKGTLLGDVYADVVIYMDGKLASSGNRVRLGRVPLQTQRGTFMVEGKEYSLPTQLRLGYGTFVHETGSGDVTAQFNVESGRGFNINYDPITKIFSIKAGGRIIGLLPLLVGMGIDHSTLQRFWGDEIFNANRKKYGPASVKKEVEKANLVFGGKTDPDPGKLYETLGAFTMDPEINEISIGKKVANVSPRLILDTSVKIIKVIQKKEDPVDRDQLQYKYVVDVNEYFKERIKAAAIGIKKKVISKLKKHGADVSKVFEYDYGTGPVMAMLKNYTQVSYADQSNPYAWHGERKKVTVVGTGGIENERQLTPNALKIDPTSYGFLDSAFTPDGNKVGAVTRLAMGVKIKDRKMHRYMRNLKTNDDELVNHRKSAVITWATADQYKSINDKLVPKTTMINAYVKGKLKKVLSSKVDYVAMKVGLFNEISQSIPFLSSTQGNRVTYGTKMMLQELPLVNSEKKYVKSMVGTFDDKDGNLISSTNMNKFFGSITPDTFLESPIDGTVTKIDNDAIYIKDKSGKTHKINKYDHMPLNDEAFITHNPTVKVGDEVKSGNTIASAPYVKDGEIATGIHLNTAYLPLEGYTLDDGVAISESGAKKMTSMHLYQFNIEYDYDLDKNGVELYSQQYPGRLPVDSRPKLDNNGIVKVGVIVNHGDYLAIKIRKRSVDETSNLKKLHRSLIKPWVDMSLIWEEGVPGKVVRVIRSGDGYDIHISTEEPITVGDKIKNLYANKATVSAIVPDSEMPVDNNGNHIELAISPLAIPSRINPSQLMEIAANKISLKTGKPFYADQFRTGHVAKELKDKMIELGIPLEDDLTYNGKKFKAFYGPQYINKLEHQSRKKMSSRYMGGYDANLQPSKTRSAQGHSSAGESMDSLTMYSAIAHNANAILKDVNAKSERNVPMWNAIEMGLPVPQIKRPYAFDKMLKYIEGAGVKVKESNGVLQMLPATDKDILRRSSGRITDSGQVHAKNLKPIKGGLYDPDILGGLDGDSMRSGHIELPTKIPNPIVVRYIAPVLDLKTAQVEQIAREKMWINVVSKDTSLRQKDGYETGWKAFKKMIAHINPERKLKEVESQLKKETNTTKLSSLLRQATILRTITQNKMSIEDLFLSKMPVMSSSMRPMYASDDGTIVSSEINKFYKNTIMASKKYKELLDVGIPPEDKTMKNLRSKIYDEYKAYQGLSVPQENDPVGLLRLIKGRGESKHGFFWKKITSKKQDLSGHSVVGPDVNIGVDNIRLPEDMGWNLYAPFIIKRLIGNGYKPLEAKKHLQDKTDTAKRAMLDEAKERPLLMNRNPSLHKFNIMATSPIISKGKQIGVNPLIHDLYNMDYDGDSSINSIYTRVSKLDIEEKIWYKSSGGGNMPFNEDEKIRYSYGVVNLKDFPRGDLREIKGNKEIFDVPDGVEVLTVWDGKEKWIKPESFHIHKDLNMVNVTTVSSRTIQCSDDHSLVAVDDDLNYEKMRPSIGITLPRLRKAVKKDSYRFLEKLKIDKLKEYQYEFSKDEFVLDYSFGYFMGVYIGDGWVSESNGRNDLCLASDSSFIPNEIKRIMSLYFDNEISICNVPNKHIFNGKDSYSEKHTWASKTFVAFLKRHIGKGADNKHLPLFWMHTNEKFRWGMLAGLIDTDGSVSITKSKSKKTTGKHINYYTNSRVLAYEVVALGHTLDLNATAVPSKTPKGKECWIITFNHESINKMQKNLLLQTPAKKEKLSKIDLSGSTYEQKKYTPKLNNDRLDELKRAIGTPGFRGKKRYPEKEVVRRKARHSMYQVVTRVKKENTSIPMETARNIIALELNIFKEEFWEKWIGMVLDGRFDWELVIAIEPIPYITEAYDLTIPPAYTMVTESGFVIFDTVSLYTPVSQKAVNEAKNMFPSKVLWHPGKKKLMLSVYQDSLVGLYKGTDERKDSGKTYGTLQEAIVAYNQNIIELTDKITIGGKKSGLGRHWVNSVIPMAYKNYSVRFDKRIVGDISDKVAKHQPDKLPKMLEELQRIGIKFATETGVTLGIKDLVVDNTKRNKFFDDAVRELDGKGVASVPGLLGEATKLINNIDPNNNFMTIMRSGSKGNSSMIGQTLFSPLFVNDHRGNVIPNPIKHSYSEGLTQTEYLNTMPGVRTGAIAKKKEISEPGFLNKLLITATAEESISMRDCGTVKGIVMSVENPDVDGRYLSKPAGNYSRNTLVTGFVINGFKSSGLKDVEVRSPLTCIAPRGICQYCYGMDEYGSLPALGRNVGTVASHSMAEPLSQGTLSLFHSGGVAGAGNVVGLLDSVSNMLKLPHSSLADATLSVIEGNVSKVKKLDTGGFNVTVASNDKIKDHFIHPSKDLSVKVGDRIEKGGKLTQGMPNFRDYFDINGKVPAQKYMIDSLNNAYKDNGHRLDQKVFEVTTRAMTNAGIISDAGSNKFFLKNDSIPTNYVHYVNNAIKNKTPVEASMGLGWQLGKSYGEFSKGETITADVLVGLRKSGNTHVQLSGEPVKYNHTVNSVIQVPKRSLTLLEQMQGQDITKSLSDAIAKGLTSETKDPFSVFQKFITGTI